MISIIFRLLAYQAIPVRKRTARQKNGTQIADLAGGSLHAVIGILSAVIHRERTGLGQAIDISMTDCSFALNAISAPLNLQGGLELEPEKTDAERRVLL
ncbi:CoA transferase [Peribacillus frigoritolerans]|nr:CoA transferase [Peribacillus frigoritolerans]